jgi:hypothetical protein
MSFFESPIVQEEIERISELGTLIAENVLLFPSLSDQQKKARVITLQEMLDKIRLFYTRLSLSDDVEAQEMKERMNLASVMMGDETLMGACDKIQYLIDEMRKALD